MELFRLLGKIAIDNAEAKKALKETSQEGQQTESKLGKVFGAIGKGAAVVGKTVATGLVAGATACVGLATAAIKSYSDYEQLVGGVETLFGTRGAKSVEEYAQMVGKSVNQVEAEFGMLQQAQSQVMENAANAYKTAGLSVNEYMESVNGIAAALNQSSASQLDSAELANQAVIDMSDNAAKMGTSMEAIQNAYAGFSKQNYTMLDNLKLGYGGTKEEMQRLLTDAEKISGIKYDISSFADVTQAIHVMQEEMGIAGTTAKEASGTIQGSLGMLKGAWSNLMTGFSDPEADLQSLIANVFESVTTFAGNLIPRVTQVLSGIATALSQLVPMIAGEIPNLLNQVLPPIIDGAVALIDGLVAALPGVISAIQSVLPDIIAGLQTLFIGVVEAIIAAAPLLIDAFIGAVDALIGALPQIIEALVSALPTLIPQLIDGFVSMIMMLVEMLPQIIQPIIDNLPTIIISIVEALVNNLPVLIEGVIQLIMGIVTAIPQIIQALVDSIPTIVSLLVEAVLNNLPAIITGLIQVVIGIVAAIPTIFNALFIELPTALCNGILDGLGKAFSNLGEWFGEKFKGAKEWAVNAWSDTKEKFNGVKEKCVEGFSNLKEKTKEKFESAKGKAVEAWSNAKEKFNGVKDKVVDAFSNLKDKAGEKFKDAKEKAVEKWNDAKSKFEGVKNKVVDGFSSLKDNVKGKFSDAKNNAVNAWSNAKSLFDNTKNKIVSAFSDIGSKFKSKFEDAKSKIINVFSGIKSKFLSIGSNVVQGIWSGISNSLSWIKGKIKGWVGDVTNFIKKLFGIKSPSTVMRDEVGRYIAEGVAVGITANSDKAEDAAEKLASNVLSAAQTKLDNYKAYNQLTLADEVGFWDAVRVQIAEGTNARIEADKKYFEAKKSLNDQILSAEDALEKTLSEIHQRIVDRKNEILKSFKLTEEFVEGNSKPASFTEMTNAIDSQIKTMEMWQTELLTLESKIGGTALYEEIAAMGLAGLSQVQEINNMTEYQLNMLLDKHAKREEIAAKMAEDELSVETLEATQTAYQTFADTCGNLGIEITNETGAMQTAVVSAIDKIREAFENFKPHMKMPHFNITGTLDLEKGSVPTVSVEWYKKAMENARILTKPTIFGYSAASGKYLGGGEAGNEVVAGEQTLMNMIQKVVAEQNSGMIAVLTKILKAIVAVDGNMSKNMKQALEAMAFEINNREFARLVKAVN